MTNKLKGSREWRVTIATKWAYIDHLTVSEILDRFEETHGIEVTDRTVRNYLDEKEAVEVEDQIKQEHANVRLKIAEREERKHKRALEAEQQATEDVPIYRTVPQTDRVPSDREAPMRWPDWEVIEPEDDDYPDWATEIDVPIRFTGGKRSLHPGEAYPVKSIDDSPKYTTEMIGLERDVDDLQGQALARKEQSSHLRQQGEVLGAFEETVNLEVEEERSLDEEDKAELVEAIEAARSDSAPTSE